MQKVIIKKKRGGKILILKLQAKRQTPILFILWIPVSVPDNEENPVSLIRRFHTFIFLKVCR